jgi:hypothetical protein
VLPRPVGVVIVLPLHLFLLAVLLLHLLLAAPPSALAPLRWLLAAPIGVTTAGGCYASNEHLGVKLHLPCSQGRQVVHCRHVWHRCLQGEGNTRQAASQQARVSKRPKLPHV